jgi:hypothetical protein
VYSLYSSCYPPDYTGGSRYPDIPKVVLVKGKIKRLLKHWMPILSRR